MKQLACNYGLIRFLPYREGGEFVNIGVILTCAPLGYFAYELETTRVKRVTDFFPRLDRVIYREGLAALDEEFQRIYLESGAARQHSRFWTRDISREDWTRELFSELVRPREAMFHMGSPRTVLAADPTEKLQEPFRRYVRQQFPQERVGGEEVLKREMKHSLEQFRLAHWYKARKIGSEDYKIELPFVAQTTFTESLSDEYLKAIKPLDLNRREPSDIYQHGDDWIAKVRRLTNNEHRPKEWLFAINYPREGQKLKVAAKSIARELEAQGVKTLNFDDKNSIREFAYIPEYSADQPFAQ